MVVKALDRVELFHPNYNPRDIIANARRLLNGEMMEPMDPWYRGFRGTIEKTDPTKQESVGYTVKGIIEEVNETTLRISELPVRKWTQDYKEFLESIMTGNDKIKDPFIKVNDAFMFNSRYHEKVHSRGSCSHKKLFWAAGLQRAQ